MQRFLLTPVAVEGLLSVFLAISAVGMALAVADTGYWGHSPYKYEGDYVIMRFQIDLFRFAILPELAGGIMPDAPLRMQRPK